MPITDVFAALRWWTVLTLIGAASTPLTLFLFKRLPDRGYAFVKLVGLLLATYIFWLLGSFGWLDNNIGGILFSLLLLVLLSIVAARRMAYSWLGWLRSHWKQIVITELVFSATFAFWVWARSQNPAIAATEKPMEFAFLNAIGRSPEFPPLDPWLSGFAISYYYFGYVMISLLARLSAVAEPIAFNLGIAWLAAGAAVASFGLVYNLTALAARQRLAIILGLAAAVAIPTAGNLEVGLELLHANGIGSPGFWEWLDVRDFASPAIVSETPRFETGSWWWWRSSRVIHEYHLSGAVEEGLEPIVEFPGFSFVLGDMHPHVLALPFALLSLAVALSWWLQGLQSDNLDIASWQAASWIDKMRRLIASPGPPFWLFTAILLGGLSFLNTWDVLIHLFVLIGAFTIAQWHRNSWHWGILTQALTLALMLVVAAVLLYFPFYLGFRSQAGPPFVLPMLMRPTRLTHFLIIFGLPLLPITALVGYMLVKQQFRHGRQGLTAAAALVISLSLLMLLLGWLVASSVAGSWQVISLAGELGITLPERPAQLVAAGWGLTSVLALMPALVKARLTYPFLTLLLAGLVGAVLMIWRHIVEPNDETASIADAVEPKERLPHGALPFVLLIAATGALLTIGPEFVYLRDNFNVRLNTVFKFYYQAWVMFGVAALASIGYMWSKPRQGGRLLTYGSAAGYTTLLAIALLFPYYAVQSRAIEYRGPEGSQTRQPSTLDGLMQMKRYNPDEYEAIQWLRDNVSGTPVIVEAVGGQYSSFARVSASTGLPTLLGWPGHELQWRGSSNPEPGIREPVVTQIYSPIDWQNSASLLDQYRVSYIYVGGLERQTYGQQIEDKLSDRLESVFRNDTVTIYRWQPE